MIIIITSLRIAEFKDEQAKELHCSIVDRIMAHGLDRHFDRVFIHKHFCFPAIVYPKGRLRK